MVVVQANDDAENSNLGEYLGMIKSEISKIPDEYIGDLSPQEVIDSSSDAFFQGAAFDLPCKYYNSLPKTKITDKQLKNFLSRTYVDRKLQEKNVFLSTDVWNKIVSSRKKSICRHFFQKIVDNNAFNISFSTIDSNSEAESFSTPVLTTIHFDFSQMPWTRNLEVSSDAYAKFKKLFKKCVSSTDVDAIYNIASLLNNFSIHKLFLPYGPSQLDESCLLYRYDHSFDKHKNGSMPPLYELVYPKEVREPHFHFTRGFGSVYKLTSRMQQQDFGVGYAIGISDLKKYLDKLNNQDFKDEKEKKIFMENDFGMPFLKLYKECKGTKSTKFDRIVDALTNLQLFYEIDENGEALAVAYNISDIFFGQNRHIYSKESIAFKNPFIKENQKEDEKDNGRER